MGRKYLQSRKVKYVLKSKKTIQTLISDTDNLDYVHVFIYIIFDVMFSLRCLKY